MNKLQKPNEVTVESRSLMQAIDRLRHECDQLEGAANLTARLHNTLTRVETSPSMDEVFVDTDSIDHNTVVDLFYLIAEKMERQISIIRNNTEHTLAMIE